MAMTIQVSAVIVRHRLNDRRSAVSQTVCPAATLGEQWATIGEGCGRASSNHTWLRPHRLTDHAADRRADDQKSDADVEKHWPPIIFSALNLSLNCDI